MWWTVIQRKTARSTARLADYAAAIIGADEFIQPIMVLTGTYFGRISQVGIINRFYGDLFGRSVLASL